MNAVAPREQIDAARRARAMLARVNKARDLVQLGAYQSGPDPELDQALALNPQLITLLQQDMHERAPMAQSRNQLCRLMST